MEEYLTYLYAFTQSLVFFIYYPPDEHLEFSQG